MITEVIYKCDQYIDLIYTIFIEYKVVSFSSCPLCDIYVCGPNPCSTDGQTVCGAMENQSQTLQSFETFANRITTTAITKKIVSVNLDMIHKLLLILIIHNCNLFTSAYTNLGHLSRCMSSADSTNFVAWRRKSRFIASYKVNYSVKIMGVLYDDTV